MEITLLGRNGLHALPRVATVPEHVHENAPSLNPREVAIIVLSLAMMSRAKIVSRVLVLVRY